MVENLVVTCVVTRQRYEIPIDGLDPEVREGLLHGEIAYLSEEARDLGWAFMTQLIPVEQITYRKVRKVGGDLLMRHLRWFVNPADPTDMRMR